MLNETRCEAPEIQGSLLNVRRNEKLHALSANILSRGVYQYFLTCCMSQ